MNYIRRILPHITIILSIMFITFWILDIFNPVMDFTGCTISNWLLLALCIVGIATAITCVWTERKLSAKNDEDQKD